MLNWQNYTKLRIFIRTICTVLIVTFSFSNIQQSQAQDFDVNQLPVPGTMVGISSPFAPLVLKGLIVNLNKPLEFQFIVDTGRGPQDTASVKDRANQLVKYFLAGLTIPEGDLWVNLSPYEKNRIVPEALGQTDLGRDLLAQDYILKQLTASLIYPEKDLGKEFWSRVYAKAQEQFGTTNVPINTFNKVWILPDHAQVFENVNAAYVTKATLKVMLDEDYLVLEKRSKVEGGGYRSSTSTLGSQIVRQIILPEIEKEVNTGKSFAPLRQIYQALILAKWYKETIQNGLLDTLYTNKKKVAGVNVNDPAVKEQIYERYLKAYKKGAFNYIKEDPTPDGQVVPRKYFSGGITQMGTFFLERTHDGAMLSNSSGVVGELLKVTVIGNPSHTEIPVGQPKQIESQVSVAGHVTLQQPSTQPGTALAQRDSGMITSFLAILGTIGYFIYRIFKKNSAKNKTTGQELSTVNTTQQPQQGASRDYQSAQPNFNLRQELENQIQQLTNAVAQSSKDALIRSFRPTGAGELPLPIPLSMLNQDNSDRDKVIHILENMQRMIDGTDEKVLRDFERAIDNARDRVTQQALNRFDTISDREIFELLTNGYVEELQREFQRIFDDQIQHMRQFYTPSTQEQHLYVSDEVNERYPRLPRYLKWILTNNSQLENDPYVREWLYMIQSRVNQIPAFPDMITGYSKTALAKSLYLNPELARRVLLFLARNVSHGRHTTEADIRREIQIELAKSLNENNFIEGEIIPDAVKALPAPDMSKRESLKARLRTLTDDYRQFMSRYREQQSAISKVETDLRELSEGLSEAKRQNDRIVIDVLQPAVEGLTSKLRKWKARLPSLNQDKARYEEQINAVRGELGDSAMNSYSLDPLSMGVVAVFTVMFGIPLYVTKKILNEWYNTIPGKTLGLTASIGSLVAGYYAYLGSLSPHIEKLLTDPANADPMLATFFIIWPVAILSGIYGGKIGKGMSHKRLYGQADSAFRKRNYEEAINLLNQAIELNPKNAQDYMLLAESQRHKSHYNESIISYKKAIEIEPNNSIIHNNLGVVYFEREDFEKAIESFKRSLELNANQLMALSNLSRALRIKGRLLEAARYLQRSQEIKPDPSVTELLNQILRQTGEITKPNPVKDLPFAKTMQEVVPARGEWIKSAYSDFDDWGGSAFFAGMTGIGGAFLYYVYQWHWWQMGTEEAVSTTQWIVWIGSLLGGGTLGTALLFIVGHIANAFISTARFFSFPSNYRKLQDVNKKSSDELSDSDLKAVAPMYARMSRDYLETIFRSWVEAGQEEKIARLLKFGKWDYDKQRIYGDIGEYKRVSRAAAQKFATTAQGQQVIFDYIDKEKEVIVQKNKENAISLMKDILPQITETSRNKDEFFYWLGLVANLPKNILDRGPKHVLAVFTDLREFEQGQQDALSKFARNNSQANVRVKTAVDGLIQKLVKDGLDYPGILKKVLVDINKAARNTDEFVFWINEVMGFEKGWFSSGSYLTILQNRIAYERAKEQAAEKLTKNDPTRQKFLTDIDNLRDQLVKKGFAQASDMLKDIIPELTKTCRTKEEFIYWLGELVGLNNAVWQRGAPVVIKNFNDLAGFKMAKEMAIENLAANQQEKDTLANAIDALRAKLEQKQPGCAGLIKDVILEILKDINVLADPPHRLNDFKWYLGKTVDFQAQTWAAGITQVLAGYQEIKEYIKKKRALFVKFTTNQEEQKRFLAVWENIDNSSNFVKPSFISLLNTTLDKIANFATNPKEFVFWIGTISELNNDVMEVFCRDLDTVLAYYKEKGKSRDFNRLPSVLNQYHKTYHQTVLITANLLDTLTDPSLDTVKRVEKMSQYFIEQKIVKLGAPQNLVGVRDSISFEDLINVIDKQNTKDSEPTNGEDMIRDFIRHYTPIQKAIGKMGRDGIYSYYESQKPIYYRHFLEDAGGLRPGFNQPGEKFRVPYTDIKVSWSKDEESQAVPITDNVQALKQLIQYLRMEWPNFYDNFIQPKRELIKGRPMEEFVTSDTVMVIAQQLLGQVLNWQFSEQERLVFVSKIMEIFGFQEATDLRVRIVVATDDFTRLRLISQYWERVLGLIVQHKWLQENSKFYRELAKVIKQKISSINDKIGEGGEGILQFYLSGGTLADFFKGWVSCDCTRNTEGDHAHFSDTQAFVMDPASFLFKVIEKNKWIGNVYSLIFKDKNGKFYLYIDMFQLNLDHPITKSNQDWDQRRVKFSSNFIRQLSGYLGSMGFDYLLVSSTGAQHKIGPDIKKAIQQDYGIDNTEALSLRKLGGTEFFSDAGVNEEFVQTISGNYITNDFQSISGYKIPINKTTSQILNQKQRDLDYLRKLLGEMANEEVRLASLIKERNEELRLINQRGQQAANAGRNAVALALKEASQKMDADAQKIKYELSELQMKIREKRGEFGQLARELGVSTSSNAAMITPMLRSVAPIISTVILSFFSLSNNAQAQDYYSSYSSHDALTPLLWFGSAVGFFGLLYYVFSKLFPSNFDHGSYYEREYFPRPRFEDYKFPDDLKAQQNQVLEKISPETRDLINHVDVRVPFNTGISRAQAFRALGLLYSTLIKDNSILKFFKGQNFYSQFKQRAHELELADDFDQSLGKDYFFTVNSISSAFQTNKQQIISEEKDIEFELKLSERTADDILRGVASGDCTSINGSAYYNTIPQFMFDPGFLAFKVMQEGKWVGNVYTIVAEKEGKPVLIVDAIQLPVWGRTWPVSVKELADKVLDKIVEYADAQGFSEVLMSSFVSNFNAIHDHFEEKYPTSPQDIEKMGGFEHLKALGIWDKFAMRNEYIETYSPHWNYSLKRVDPNNPKQTLLLRTIWKSDLAQIVQEIQYPASKQVPVATERTKSSGVKKYSSIGNTIKKMAIGLMIATPLLLATAGSAQAATFTHNPNGTLQVTVEKHDTFGQILLDAGYRGHLWGANGHVAKLRGHVEKQIPTRNVNRIKPGYHFNIRNPQYSLETQRTINKINQETESVQAEVRNLRQENGDLKVQVADLKAKLDQANKQIEQLKTTHKLPDAVTQLQNKKNDYARQIADLEIRQAQAREDLNRLMVEREKTKQEVANLQNQKIDEEHEAENLKAQANQLKTQNEQLQNQVTGLQSQKGALEGKVNQLNQQKEDLQKQLSALSQQVGKAKGMLEQANAGSTPSYKNIWSSFSWWQKLGISFLALTVVGILIAGFIMWKRLKRFENLNDKVIDLQNQADALEARLEAMRQEKENLTQEIDQKKNQNADLEASKKTQEADLETAKEELARIKVEFDHVQVNLVEAKKKELGGFIDEKEALEENIRDLQDRKTELEAGLLKIQQELEQIEQRLREVQSSLESQTQANGQALSDQQAEIQSKEAEKQTLQEQIAALDQDFTRKRQEALETLRRLDEERTKIKREIDFLMNQREAKSQELEGLSVAVSILSDQRTTLQNETDALKQREDLLRDKISKLEEKKKELTEGQGVKEQGIQVIEPEVDDLVKKTRTLVDEIEKVDTVAFGRQLDGMLERVGPLDNTKIYPAVIQEVKDALQNVPFEIQEENYDIWSKKSKKSKKSKNLIVKIAASKGMENLPKIILNAHWDVNEHGFTYTTSEGRTKKSPTAALDDRSGVLSILGALHLLNKRVFENNIPHGPIVLIFTDDEEEGMLGSQDLLDKYGKGVIKDLFDNTYAVLVMDGPILWGDDKDLLELNEHERENPFIIAKLKNIDISSKIYEQIRESVRPLNFKDFREPRFPDADGAGDHWIFAQVKDKKLNRPLSVVNIRSPYNEIDPQGNIVYETKYQTVDVMNQLVPIAQWISEIVTNMTDDLVQSSKKTSGIMLATQGNAEPTTLWKYEINDGKVRPVDRTVSLLSPQAGDEINRVLEQLSTEYPSQAFWRIKSIRIVAGNKKLAEINRANGEIILDINVFANKELLLMELEHEILHTYLPSYWRQKDVRDDVLEEFMILLLEISRFFQFNDQQQADVLNVLKTDPKLDEKEFYKILIKAKEQGNLASVFDDILAYMKEPGVYPSAFKEYLREKSIKDIFGGVDAEKYYVWPLLYDKELINRAGIDVNSLIIANIFSNIRYSGHYTFPGRKYAEILTDIYGKKLLPKLKEILKEHNYVIKEDYPSIEFWFRATIAMILAKMDDPVALLLLSDLIRTTPDVHVFSGDENILNHRLAILVNEYSKLMKKYREQEGIISNTEADLEALNEGLAEARQQNDRVIIEALQPAIERLTIRLEEFNAVMKRLTQEKTTYESQINLIRADLGETGNANSPKGKGVYTPSDHQIINQVIATAQRDRRGELIWGNAPGWADNRAKYAKSISWDIESLRKKYPSVKIPKLGKVEIADVLSASSIVLILPRTNAPPGLVVNNINSYQIAHNGLTQNTIYIDRYTYSKLLPFETAILLAHEAIQLGAKKLAARRGIPWDEQLAQEVATISDEWEIQIVGKSDKGRGSRFDDRIEEILGFNQPKPITEEPYMLEIKPKPQVKPAEENNKFSLNFPDTKDNVIDALRKLFLESMFREPNANLPAKWGGFPPPIANEIKHAYELGKIKGMPLDPDFYAALTVFFSGIFPNHTNSLISYLRTLNIYIIDNGRSTFGATLDGNTFFIQRSVFEDLLKRPISVDEIYQSIKERDKQVLVALFRIIIHEIGAAFYKTSHEASQDLEKLFLGLLSKTIVTLSYRTQEEFRNINNAIDLNSLPRLDWAIDESVSLGQDGIRFTGTDIIRSIIDLVNINPATLHVLKGGIDLNQIYVKRTGKTINVQFDQAQLNELTQDGFEGFTPVIINMTRIQNLLPLLGINVPKEPEVLVKV